ncbi:MAG: methylenetetrahydrofolate reductase [NAD(P)H] [Halieaceae bacterium]
MEIDKSLALEASDTAARLSRRPKPASIPIRHSPKVSFELFPPSTEEGWIDFGKTVGSLDTLDGQFMSVTYGAGGTSQDRTLRALSQMTDSCATPIAGHLTCASASRQQVMEVVETYKNTGVKKILALRGDPPKGAGAFQPHPQGFSSAAELVAAIAKRGDFDIAVAAYPEGHPEAQSLDTDLDNLKRKIDCGARHAITQFFFEADTYLRFRDRAVKAGIQVPIIPGILPVINLERTISMAKTCGTHVPDWVGSLFDGLDDAPQIRSLVAATVTAELCTRLRDQGADWFHFYTLNRSELAWAICHMLGLRTAEKEESSSPAVAQSA